MQIAGFQKVKSISKALAGSAMLSMPFQGCATGKAAMAIPPVVKSIPKTALPTIKAESGLTKGLPRYYYPNIKGGMVEGFGNDELWKISDKIFDTTESFKYTPPIDTAYKPYIAANGNYGTAVKGYGGILPNLGIDISIKATDPKQKPIAVLAPIDGVIVKQRTPLAKAGIQQTQIMGTDGMIYSFSFARKVSDYAKANLPFFQKIGTPVKANDTLGLMSNLPKSDVFELHMEVEDLAKRQSQQESTLWQGLNSYFGVALEGQVNPLDSTKAGGISSILNRYKREKGTVLPVMKELEDIQ